MPSIARRAVALITALVLAPATALAQPPAGTDAPPLPTTPNPSPTTSPPETAPPATTPPKPPDVVDNPRKEPPPEPKKPDTGHFEFGSYGRVRIASDLRGGTGRQANIVTHGDRIDEESYAELEIRRED